MYILLVESKNFQFELKLFEEIGKFIKKKFNREVACIQLLILPRKISENEI